MILQNAFIQFVQQFDPRTKAGQVIQSLSAQFTITGAINNGSGAIRITAPNHGLLDGYRVFIKGVIGTTEANSTTSNSSWQITWVSANSFDLVGSTFTNAYSSGGIGVGALIGSVDGDKLTKERQLSCWNQARIALLQGARQMFVDDTGEISKRFGGNEIVDEIVWTRTGAKATAPRPSGLIKLNNLISPSGFYMNLMGQEYLAPVAAGLYEQDTRTIFVFEEGSNYVHHGSLVTSSTAITITGATNASPIIITAANHGLATGDLVKVVSVGGNTAANGEWFITKINTNQFSLDGSTGNGAYTSGGSFTPLNRISYLGLTDWTLSQVTDGTTEETVTTGYIPYLIQLSIAIAKGMGGGQVATLAAQLLGAKQ